MTEIPAEVFETVARGALHELATAPSRGALEALSGCDVLIPAVSAICYTSGRGGSMRFVLPVVERMNAAPAVMVFTSEERLLRAFPCVPCYRPVTLRQLAAHWPTGAVVLVIDAGDEESLTLSAREAQWFLAHCPV
ncbi:SseB family protein [Streptomyces sp. MK7]|uniref:SseB family protein n=1 Tax=Streptomyces sp. MK7 TaxID=3067635 RepID=UPI002930BF09|nr:SseB family protein [Streptomyces sp. MK7]